MKLKLIEWDDSLWIRIPTDIKEKFDLHEDDLIDIQLEDSQIVIELINKSE